MLCAFLRLVFILDVAGDVLARFYFHDIFVPMAVAAHCCPINEVLCVVGTTIFDRPTQSKKFSSFVAAVLFLFRFSKLVAIIIGRIIVANFRCAGHCCVSV